MGKIQVEVCLISGRGLPRFSSLWKHHWFAVGWIDPDEKYCTSIDSSGNPNPVWRTKFTYMIECDSESSFDFALHVEVYSRDPIFLREKLQGTLTIPLKEFLVKHGNKDSSDEENVDVGSFQLRKKNSSKPCGFVDISIATSEEKEGAIPYTGSEEGFQLTDNTSIGINFNTEAGSTQGLHQMPYYHPRKPPHPQPYYPYAHPTPYPSNYTIPSMVGPQSNPQAAGPSYPPPGAMPLPPQNVGYAPTFLPGTAPTDATSTYINMPQSAGAGRGQAVRPGFAAGLGAGALAAGAVIYEDNFMLSGFDLPSFGFHDPTLALSINPPF